MLRWRALGHTDVDACVSGVHWVAAQMWMLIILCAVGGIDMYIHVGEARLRWKHLTIIRAKISGVTCMSSMQQLSCMAWHDVRPGIAVCCTA